MRSRTFYGKIEKGKLVLDHRAMFQEYVSTLKNCEIELVLRKAKKDITHNQWAYLYASVYKEFADHLGWTIDAVDVWMKKKFMKENGITLPDGLILTKTAFDRVWLAKYVDFCIMAAAFEGVVVPPPKLKLETKA
ncbi:hypothetical protein LCGC14_2535210 [marine sediment metagenome]|uniref:Uncharacterized protein n=1 Tax=marine sediment metagenome TaxID=412755 RepID=A0A0F9DKF5_9ZZZZ